MLLPDGLLLASSTERSVRKDRQVIRSSTDLTKCLLEAEAEVIALTVGHRRRLAVPKARHNAAVVR